MKKISVVTPCFNEKENIKDLVLSVRKIFREKLENYKFEHIVIDNNSDDGTKDILRNLATNYSELKLIFKALPENDPMQRKPDITKAKNELNWEPKINIEQGLDITIKWFRENIIF